MVKFDSYSGPTLPNGTVPITPLRHTWFNTTKQCSRLQLPLKLAWTVTIHKAQGMTLKVVIDIGKKEFSTGLTYVACSRVRHLKDLLLTPPFAYERLANLAKSSRLQERLIEDARLSTMSTRLGQMAVQVTDPQLQEINLTSLPDCCADIPPPDLSKYRGTSVPPSPALLPPTATAEVNDEDNVTITHVDIPEYPFKYFPVDEMCQRYMCRITDLNFIRPNGVVPGGPDVRLAAPDQITSIDGYNVSNVISTLSMLADCREGRS